ncbi:hypothetical protein K438DRAFT_1761706 [Mycena galopus ATCC 62051]|nr:hypothetical protein K438DRAFT_1761706 [Mycena galopus ATCC 62051]
MQNTITALLLQTLTAGQTFATQRKVISIHLLSPKTVGQDLQIYSMSKIILKLQHSQFPASDSAFRRDTTGLPTIHAVMAASRKDHPSESHAVGYDTVELPTLDQEMPSPSETFKFLMNIKLVLILLLALFGLYDPA